MWVHRPTQRSPSSLDRMTAYGPRVNVHPDRYGAVKNVENRLIVLHTSEGGETTGSAEALGRFMEQPGDRIGINGPYGASYQAVFDTDRVLPATRDNIVAFAAAGANHDGVHGCFPGKAAQTRAQWLDANSHAMMRQCRDWMRDKSLEHKIPLVRLTDDEIHAGRRGYCDHWAVSRVYKQSTHTDLGSGFPWDVLADLLSQDPTPGGPTVAERLVFKNYRLYDSRERDGKLAGDRQLGVTDPEAAGAVGLECVIGLSEVEGAGFLSAWKGGTVWPGTITVPWVSTTGVAATKATVELGPFGAFNVKVAGQPQAKTHFTVDVVGYWMP